MLPVADTRSAVETYKGESYKLTKREIATFSRGITKVWIYEILTGPGKGVDGGKNSTKAEARRWARHNINAWAEEAMR